MHERGLLHTLFSKTLGFIHAKRLSALLDAVQALFIGKRLSLTYLGRHLQSVAKERNCIRKMDRLLGNKYLHNEIRSCYHATTRLLLNGNTRPIISVDWAATDKRKSWHILRATLNIHGRGYVLYQEVHPQIKNNSRKVQNQFLDKLKSMLPNDCKPIIVADAGFRFPWFKKIRDIGFDFVGRVRHKGIYKSLDGNLSGTNCLNLYRKATNLAQHLGKLIFTREWGLECEVVLYKKKNKHRKHINRLGNPTNNNASNRCARNQRDPWMLVTSLDVTSLGSQCIVNIYAKRMQIEEDFRDIKSHKFGFGLRYSLSKSAKRIEVLLLIAALACLTCWLISISAMKNNLHLSFQSNTIKDRNVLSVIYLGCQLIRRKFTFTFEEIKEAYHIFCSQIKEASLCCNL